MGALTLQVVEEEGDDLVAAVDLAVELQDVGRERVALEAEDLQFEELAHLPGQDADEVVVEEQIYEHPLALPDLHHLIVEQRFRLLGLEWRQVWYWVADITEYFWLVWGLDE